MAWPQKNPAMNSRNVAPRSFSLSLSNPLFIPHSCFASSLLLIDSKVAFRANNPSSSSSHCMLLTLPSFKTATPPLLLCRSRFSGGVNEISKPVRWSLCRCPKRFESFSTPPHVFHSMKGEGKRDFQIQELYGLAENGGTMAYALSF